jgi:NTE family protein
MAPAVHLGASRILAVSTRYSRTREEADTPLVIGYPPPAQVAGSLFNAIFLDALDGDALHMQQLNDLLGRLPAERHPEKLRRVELLVIRPSEDLGRLANEYEANLPRGFRFLTRGLGTKETRSNDMLSLVMFQADYISRLIAMGEADAAARHSDLCELLTIEHGTGNP